MSSGVVVDFGLEGRECRVRRGDQQPAASDSVAAVAVGGGVLWELWSPPAGGS